MANPKTIVSSVAALTILVGLFVPLVMADYSVGVSAGKWVKYGNFVATSTSIPMNFTNQTDWLKIDVVSVSRTNVTLGISGQYKNGTAVTIGGMKLNVATGASNFSLGDIVFLIPSNLTQGALIPVRNYVFALNVTKVETKNYMGVNRKVCVFNFMGSVLPTFSYKYIMAWDQASGMLMEANLASTTPYGNMTESFNAIDTNMFTTGIVGTLMDNAIYVALVVVVIIVIVLAAITLLRRKPKTPAPTTTPATAETPATTQT